MKKLLILTLLVFIIISGSIRGSGSGSLTFLTVGQGESTIISCPNGKIVVIDAGDGTVSQPLFDYLKSINAVKIDYLIITNPHEYKIMGRMGFNSKSLSLRADVLKIRHNGPMLEGFLKCVKPKYIVNTSLQKLDAKNAQYCESIGCNILSTVEKPVTFNENGDIITN
jgi:hypothetical protein